MPERGDICCTGGLASRCKDFQTTRFQLVRFYGRISYSLYLLHLLGIVVAIRVLGPINLETGLPVWLYPYSTR